MQLLFSEVPYYDESNDRRAHCAAAQKKEYHPGGHGRTAGRNGRRAAEHDDGDVLEQLVLLYPLKEVVTPHAWHTDVGDDEVGGIA